MDDLPANGKHVYQIEERIKRLQAVILQLSQKWRPSYTTTQLTNFAGEVLVKGADNDEAGDKSTESKIRETKTSKLVSKALGMEKDTNEDCDCNICFEMAKDPVLTLCGHLFCWPCIYQLPYTYADARECPVCVGEVLERDLIPIYGSTAAVVKDSPESNEYGSGSKIPPRPDASRVENLASGDDTDSSDSSDELEYF